MPARKTLSSDVKKLIVDSFIKGETSREVASRFKITFSAACKIFRKWQLSGTVERKKQEGRPSKVTQRLQNSLIRLIKKTPEKRAPIFEYLLQRIMGWIFLPQLLKGF